MFNRSITIFCVMVSNFKIMNILIGVLSIIGVFSLWCFVMFTYTPNDEYVKYSKKEIIISWVTSLVGISITIYIIRYIIASL